MAALAQEGAVLRARIIPLLLALGLRRSQHVRVMRDTILTMAAQRVRHAAWASIHQAPAALPVRRVR